ncbi:TetR/AcrR family transcriptional regulator [Alicyclobacillus sp. ALC3]|uniref:TetR/AcrR family transcriptional regulator n=1 Tax=Alicyclobacillus sp. ALC3 TaxID=2796143 RepID=UPI0023799A3E|nr:TetR/AcrR family transcriptional regulator [Alicyclobacillus sp. ALC3]WDL96006.1 TetR/AcrR family transcriptional regulator [Alicyclobacillus sp. ALC3]
MVERDPRKVRRSSSPRRRSPEERKEQLVLAAVRVLRDRTEVSNWVSEVTKEADVAKGTFYVYFSSWEEMLAIVRRRLTEQGSLPIRAALTSNHPIDYWSLLKQQCESFIDLAMEFRLNHSLIFHSALLDQPGDASSSASLLEALIRRGIEDAAFTPVDVEPAAHLLFAVIHAATDAVLAGGDTSRWVAACLSLARGYLSVPAKYESSGIDHGEGEGRHE